MDKLQPLEVQKQNEATIFELIKLRNECENEGIPRVSRTVKSRLAQLQEQNNNLNCENYFYNVLDNQNINYICK